MSPIRPALRRAAMSGRSLRLRHRRWRVGGLRACQSAERRSRHFGARARGRPPRFRLGPAHPHAGRAVDADRQSLVRLALRERAGAAHARAAHRTCSRQGARRVEQHQRHDLPARQSARLRALGGRAGHAGLGLRALPAVFQAHGDLPGRGGRMARRQRAARARARAGYEPAVRGVFRRGRPGRISAHRRRQRVPAGGLCEVRSQHTSRTPAERRAGLPASGHAPTEPDRTHAGARDVA